MKKINIELDSLIIKNKKRLDLHKFSLIFDDTYLSIIGKLAIIKFSLWLLSILDIFSLLYFKIDEILFPILFSLILIYFLINEMNKIYIILRKKEEEADEILEYMFKSIFDVKNININKMLLVLNDIILDNITHISKLEKKDIKLFIKKELFKRSGELKK